MRAAATAYFRAVGAHDGRKMCASLTAELRRHIARLQQSSCQEAMRAESRSLPESLNGYRVTGVRVEGDRATVSLGGGAAGTGRMVLRGASGSWKISSAPGLGA